MPPPPLALPLALSLALPLALSDALSVALALFQLLFSAAASVVLFRLTAWQRRYEGIEAKLQETANQLVEERFRALTTELRTHVQSFVVALDELRTRAQHRVEKLHEQGVDSARLYGDDPHDGVGGDGAFFLLLDEPEVYGLPPDPVVTTRDLPSIWKQTALAAAALGAGIAAAFAGRRG